MPGCAARVVPGSPEKPSESADEHAHSAPARMGWARLLERVFDIDLANCLQCGGAFRIIAAIDERAVIVRMRVEWPASAGRFRRARCG